MTVIAVFIGYLGRKVVPEEDRTFRNMYLI
jgi:hypothetical protein